MTTKFEIRRSLEAIMNRVAKSTQHPTRCKEGILKLLIDAGNRFSFQVKTKVAQRDSITQKLRYLDMVWMLDDKIIVAMVIGNTLRSEPWVKLSNLNYPQSYWIYLGVSNPPVYPENISILRPPPDIRKYSSRSVTTGINKRTGKKVIRIHKDWKILQGKPHHKKELQSEMILTYSCGHTWKAPIKTNPASNKGQKKIVEKELSICPTCKEGLILPGDYYIPDADNI